MTGKLGILFLQSHERFGADAAIHAHLMRGLSRERFEVHLACTQGSGDEPPASARVLRGIPALRFRSTHFVPGLHGLRTQGLLRGLRSARAFPRDFQDLVRYVRANRIRLIHSGDHPRDAVYNVLLGKLTGAKSVVHVHVKWATHYSKLAQWAVRSSDAIFSISRYVTGTVREVAGRRPEDIFTVLNCVDVSSWDPATDGSGIRREFGIAPDGPLIISVSRLFSWKGQRELLKAFAGARAQLPALKLLIVGADETEVEPGSFTEELRGLAEQLGVSNHVVFTGQRSDIPQLMAACDVFALPSFEEPFGLVFLEAMAMCRPVVALDNGGTPEVVEHGQSGLLSPPGDIAGLTANIVRLLNDRELRARMGERGRARVLEYFNAERMTADATAAYEEILARA
jgi:glycosyltransferase involved in cell wall biosynthesis